MGCANVTNPCRIRPLRLGQIPLPKWGGVATGRKAVAIVRGPNKGQIWIDPKWWNAQRSVGARAAVFFHEVGHLEGADCEPCADHRAGVWIREFAMTHPRDGARGMLDSLENRDAVAAALEVLDGAKGLDLPTVGGLVDTATSTDPELAKLPTKSATGYSDGKPFALVLVEVWPNVWVAAGEAARAWRVALRTAKEAGASPSSVGRSFATYAEQAALRAKYEAGKGPLAARPGYSNHQQGRSVDLSFASDAAREAFATIAARFGIERDVSSERWHFTHGGKRRFPLVAAGGLAFLLLVAAALIYAGTRK